MTVGQAVAFPLHSGAVAGAGPGSGRGDVMNKRTLLTDCSRTTDDHVPSPDVMEDGRTLATAAAALVHVNTSEAWLRTLLAT